MTSQVYYRKWRPGSFSQLVGQDHVATTLRQSTKQGRVSHSYLFCGPRGSGKTTTARIVAKAVNCLDLQDGDPCNNCSICQSINDGRFMDIIELDAASNRGIDEIRDIREKVNFSPGQGSRKVYIIDEAHMLTDAASNAFLKTLEEPPSHVIFILCTTEAHKILPTIISRCQRFDFRRIPSDLIYGRLGEIALAEGAAVEPEALRLVARYAAGSLRDAENLLEQLVVSYSEGVGIQQVEELLGLGHGERWLDLVKYLLMGNTSASLGVINQAAWDGTDLRQLHRQTLELMRAAMLLQWGPNESVDLPDQVKAQMQELVGQLPDWRIVKSLKLWGEVNMRYDAPSTLPLELAAVEICNAQAAPTGGVGEQSQPAPLQSAPPAATAARRPPPATARAPEPRSQPTERPRPVPAAEPADLPASVESTPVVADIPTLEGTPTVGDTPTVEGTPAVADIPTLEGTPAVADIPTLEGTPAVGDTPTVEDIPTVGDTPTVEHTAPGGPSIPTAAGSDLVAKWTATVKALARHKGKKYNLGALMRDCRADRITLEGNTLILAFSHRANMERMQEELEDATGKRLVTDLVSQNFGGSYDLKLTVLEDGRESNNGAGMAPSSPLVRAALGMGARIIEEVPE